MRIHVAARSEEYVQKFSKNNRDAKDVVLHRGAKSLFTLLQTIIDGEDDYALFVHDDVFLPSSINDYLSDLIEMLNEDWPNWGICGNAGIIAPTLASGSRVCRFLFDPHGGPSISGFILPAETVDGNTILLNCRALRAAGVRLPSFEGFQFYDICLSVETLAAGLAVLLAPQLAVYHDSKGNQSEFDRAFGSKALIEYLSNKLSNRTVNSLNGILKLPFSGKRRGQLDICDTSLKNASLRRPEARIAFVIRTQFREVALLLRAINSTLAFAAATQNRSIKTYIVTEYPHSDVIEHLPDDISVIAADHSQESDSRNHLIEHAIRSVDEDFILFLDDDDWVFPNEANYITNLLTCLPTNAHLIVESQHFSEAILVPGETDWRNSSVRPQRRFESRDWPLNFTGNNYVPMCGAFYSRYIISQQPKETFEKITFYEDYTLSLFALLNKNSIFFSLPKLLSGISIRNAGGSLANTVNVADRTRWNQSQAELAHQFCSNTSNNVALSIGEAFSARIGPNGSHIVGQQNAHLSWLDRKSIASSRFIHGLVMFLLHPADYVANLKNLTSAIRSSGVRGCIRSIADLRAYSRRSS
ncbi:hypothetical protein [Brucella sp. NBRC 12950]|uniref:hypothetical protein n=1 Tax=Brucella sp. NBRC 12950 TaxID=2994518 RepID=UPI0025542BED|nr:hypothetical protein [Brucella sp. NBRC 12950]